MFNNVPYMQINYFTMVPDNEDFNSYLYNFIASIYYAFKNDLYM